jgi:Ca-activated chloride channel family protein
MDVDTASYTLARKYLVDNQLPEKAQIRTEEFVNYFKPDVAPPTKGTFAIATELAPSRYSNPVENKWMLRVAVRGVEVPKTERAPLALTFVVDVSGSMREGQRLDLVKHALRQLVGQLDARDSISIVTFSDDARLILPMTSAGKRDLIESAINPLQPESSTNTEAGLRMGYAQAVGALTMNATNRVVLLTDGVANVGITDPNALVETVERQRKAGIYLNTIGVGMQNHNDNLLEQLADKGDGLCNYVDDAAEVKHALVDNFLQTLVPIARDAKVQVEFDPTQVQSYRLLGYENRAIADQDFRNDKVDAGEINSGHQVTAMYEIVRIGNFAQQDAPLANVHVRFKPPHKNGIAQPASEEASEISKPVFAKDAAGMFEATSFGYRRAVLAAQFAEFLRRSVHARGDSLDQLIADAQKLAGEKKDPEVAELSDMVMKSKVLLQSEFARRGDIDAQVYSLRNDCWEHARLEALQRESDREAMRILDEQIHAREIALRTLLNERLK